ncbi:MAG: endonuclease III [archaeon]
MKREEKIRNVINILKKKSRLTMLGGFSKNLPFYILISTILSQRNRDESTIKVAKQLFSVYKTPKALANAPIRSIEKLIKQSGFYHTKAKRIKEVSKILLDKYTGNVPKDYEELVALPGVGPKTAGCVLVYAYGKPAIPVDTHVHRISNRLGWAKTKTPEKTQIALEKIVPKDLWMDVNEVLVIHGQTICKPITPLCDECGVRKYCPKVDVLRKI